jgi:NAD(P)-dependent dehydrogenase (short-subunit alcohol dehydrogenase family)
MSDRSFSGRSVIITGASSGIGRALALRLADEGAWCARAARDSGRLDVLAKECEGRGGRAIAVPTDVANEERCLELVQRTQDAYGRLDMLINNAGMGVVGRLQDLPDLRLFERVMDVNFRGAVYCTYHALPHLRQAQGRVVNISSLSGLVAIPFNSPYASSKFAMMGFSDSLRMEVKSSGMSVTVVCPYWVVSELHERLLDKHGQPRGPAARARYSKRTMTSDRCAQITLEAARRRRRQVTLWPGQLGLLLKLLAPGLADRLVSFIVLGPRKKKRASADKREPGTTGDRS